MPRRFIKRYLPDTHKIREHRYVRVFGARLHDPNLWHLNKYSVSGGVSLGIFIAFMPIPMQMLLAAALAILVRVNLPVSVMMVWITNPLTIPPIFYSAYRLGAWILQSPMVRVKFELSVDWLQSELSAIWQPFLLGCFLMGLIAAIIGNLFIRIGWRTAVLRSWQTRRRLRLSRRGQSPE